MIFRKEPAFLNSAFKITHNFINRPEIVKNGKFKYFARKMFYNNDFG